jgi:anti-sigma regulatory factor (Ser/Thr protein kinase)
MGKARDMRDTLDCSAEPSSVRAARLFVVDKLQEWRCDDLVDSAALVTSELATNAVVHTGLPYSVHVERRADGVRVEVVDLRQDLPLRADATATTHREGDGEHDLLDGSEDPSILFSGLGMVDAVATRWGSEPMPGNGKVVWFELVTSRSGESRSRGADLRDLRADDDDAWSRLAVGALVHDGREARHLARSEDFADPDVWGGRRHVGRWLLVGTVLVVVVVGGLVLFGR